MRKAPPAAGAAGSSAGWPLALLLAGTHVLAYSDRVLIALVAQPLKQALALSDAELGFLQGSAFAVPHALALPLAGALADRGYRRAILLLGLGLWTAATLACGLGGSFASVVAARAALGLGQAALVPAALALLAHRLAPGSLGLGVSLLTAGGSLGRSLALLGGGLVLAWLVARGGLVLPGLGPLAPWQALFVLACLPNLLVLPLLRGIAEPPAGRRSGLRAAGPALAWVARRRAAYLPHFAAAAAAMLINQSLTAWAPAFLVRVHGDSPARSGLTLGAIVLVAAPLGHVAGGRILDRWRRAAGRRAAPRLLALGLGLTLPATALLTLATDRNAALAGFAGLVIALGLTSPAALGGLQFLTPRALRGRISALFVAGVTLVALGLGPLLVGILNDAVFGAAGLGRAMLAAFTAFALAGLGLCGLAERGLRSRERARRGRTRARPAQALQRV
ncbi:MFS transporter [Methylobacterium sp. A54F]